MKILLVGNFLSKVTGSRDVCEDLSEHMKNLGWHVVTTSHRPGRIRRLIDIIFTIIRYRHTYEVAHVEVFSGLAFIWAEVSGVLLGWLNKPFVLSLHGGNLPDFAQRWPKRVQFLLTNARIVVTPSRYIQQELKWARNDIGYLPNALDIRQYPFRLRKYPRPALCWLRAFSNIYNPILAIEVVAQLQKTFPDIHLTMIGPDKADGSYEQVLNKVKEKNIEQHIDFTGAITKIEVPLWLQKYDVFINTTRIESFGIAVMEAGAVGLPIVTTNVGELPYLWSDNENALLVPPDDAVSMANAVERILTERGLAEKLSRNARLNAEQFDWSAILTAWEDLIQKVLDDPCGRT